LYCIVTGNILPAREKDEKLLDIMIKIYGFAYFFAFISPRYGRDSVPMWFVAEVAESIFPPPPIFLHLPKLLALYQTPSH